MSALGSANLQDNTTELLASQSRQPAGPSVLPPFSEYSSVDEGLKLSNENFRQLIENTYNVQRNPAFPTPNLLTHVTSKTNLASKWDYFLQGKIVSPLSQVTAMSPFPTPHVLAQFAYKAYEDYKVGETDAQYETRLALPDGWKLLTTASNGRKANGYFGAAYWHPEHQQVVIAHRGTVLQNLGALWADVFGVIFKHHVPQMESANTFAHKVVEVLREISQKKRVSFELFFTGHSLGGWLAQVTTFTTEYLKREGKFFLRSIDDNDCCHPHTVVFDSPGCQDMLTKMTDKLDVLYEGRSIDLEHLDITSYLSAPNRINTCNKHLGTVCRIFPDFSDMSWLGKHTVLYNLEAHSMKKIVDFFQTKEGQIYKDEQGKLKILEVIDWPICAGFRRGEEYESFFKEAKHLNDYHLEVTDVTFQIKGYHPMRYQTKPYDERASRLNVFSQEERQFLESYRWLCKLPEFFKPEELFSEMEDSQAQEQAVNILKDFEIKKDKIRCTDVSAFQVLIPYVKRLLQLFPQIKVNTKCALSSDEIRKSVYQFETRRYVERISQSPLEFNPDTAIFREFLEFGQQKFLHLQIIEGEEWTGLIKVYQVLQKTGCLSEYQYTVLKLKRLLKVNQLMDLSALMQSIETQYLLLLACEDNNQLDEDTKDVIRTLFDTIKQKANIKIIFITRSEGSTVDFLRHMCRRMSGKGFVRRSEKLTWSDLTASSQTKLLKKPVKFQGSKISLNELMSAESPVVKFLPLGDLLDEKELKIAVPVPISNGYNESYYIGRTFRLQNAIKQEIFSEKDVKEKHVSLASEEREFRQLCQLNPNSSVHWLEKDETGKLVWQQSQGNLVTLRKYVDTEISHTYTADDLIKLLQQAEQQRVILISDTAGMGKSTVLTYLSKQIKQNIPAKWVVRIDLNDHTDALKVLMEEGIEQIDENKAVEFISGRLLKLKPGLEMELFKQCCEQKQEVRVIIMLDGFDEISPNYKQTVIDLLQVLRQTAVEQLWVTTRPHLRNELEDKLQQLSYTLEPFSEENQVEFLTKFWSLKEWLIEMDSKEKEEKKVKLVFFAKELTKKLSQSISDKDKEFTGIPLQCRMLAEAFDEEVETFCQSMKSVPELPLKIGLLGLYQKFLEKKYNICAEEKFKFSMTNVGAEGARKEWVQSNLENNQKLALKVLFPEEQEAVFHIESQCTSLEENLSRIGIVQIGNEGKLNFIHRTFAEFYVADYIVNKLTKRSNISQKIEEFILQKIFLGKENRVIRVFIDRLLSNSKPPHEVLKQYGNRIHDLGEDGLLTLHTGTREGNVKIIEFLLDSVQVAGHTDTLVGMLLAQDVKRQTAWHVAAENGEIEALEKLCKYAEEVLNKDEIKYKLFLARDWFEKTVLHLASYSGNIQMLERIWDLAKHYLTTEELNNLLLAQDNEKKNAWHVAAERGEEEILGKLWDWAKEALNTDEVNNNLLLAKDTVEKTVLNNASYSGNTQILERIWQLAKEQLTTKELNKLLLAQDNERKTAWHVAAERGKVEILDNLWVWAKEVLNTNELNNNLLLAKDTAEKTVLHLASYSGNKQILERIWELAKEQLTTEELNKLLLAQNDRKQTAWHMSAQQGEVEILDSLWVWAKEVLNTEELNINLLLTKNRSEETVLHLASYSGNIQILERIWNLANEQLTTEGLKKFLLAQDKRRKTAWHAAAKQGELETLDKLWEWAKEVLNTNELNNKLLLAKDRFEKTVFHFATYSGNIQILERIWKLCKEQLTTKELRKLVLAQDNERKTALHMAAKGGVVEILDKFLDLAKEILNTDELNNNLLLAKDWVERTALHHASYRGNIKTLERVWDFAKEQLTREELNKLFLAQDNEKKPALHVAAERGIVEILDKLWDWAKEVLNTDELTNNLLIAKDRVGKPLLHLATYRGNLQILERIWKLSKEQLTTEELNKVLLGQDDERKTAWHVAAEQGELEILDKLWDWAKEVLNTDELNNNLLLAKDRVQKTVLDHASYSGDVKILERIWKLAKEQLTTEELNKLLLAQDDERKTIWHVAAERGEVEILDKFWVCAKEVLNTNELNNNLLLAEDRFGRTALHHALYSGNIQILDIIWKLAKEHLTTEELKKLLLAQDDERKTIWHVAAERGEVEILEKVLGLC